MTADWQARAACSDAPSELFFPSAHGRRENERLQAQAFAICKACPVKVECQEFAQTSNRGQKEQWGIWAAKNYGPRHSDQPAAWKIVERRRSA